MPTCPSCGRQFSGFSFGSMPANECRDCRQAKANSASADAISAPNRSVAAAVPANFIPTATLAIIGINAAVYIAMGLSGASWTQPSIAYAIRWGADYGPLTLSTQPWRLVTSMFVHFGFLHIFFNMWCLYRLGISLEYLMGRKTFIATYLVSGLTASVVSVAWAPFRVSAGASGAIFGVAGSFAMYMFVRKIPPIPGSVRQTRGSLAIFIIYNLVEGAANVGIDNAAHVGGLMAGLLLGLIIPPVVKLRKQEFAELAAPAVLMQKPVVESRSEEDGERGRLAVAVVLGSVFLLLISFAVARSTHADSVRYGQAVALIRSGHSEQAIAKLEAGAKRGPESPSEWLLLGELFLDRREPGLAVEPLEKALAIQPENKQVEYNLALADLGAGKLNDAITHVQPTIDADYPGSLWAGLYIRGVAEGEMSEFQEAVGDLRRAQDESRPDLKDALEHFERLQNADQASKAKRDPHPPASQATPARDPAPSGEGGSLREAATPLEIPYAELVMKSREWPLIP